MLRPFQQSLFLSIGTLIVALWVASGGLLYYLGISMQETVREQILSRDIHLLSALSDLQSSAGFEGGFPIDDHFAFIESASELRDILGVRLVDLKSGLVEAIPSGILASDHTDQAREKLTAGMPVYQFIEQQPLDLLFEGVGVQEIGRSIPIFDLSLPIAASEGEPASYVRFWIDGSSIADEFAELDEALVARGLSIWGVIGLVLLAGGSLAYLVIKRLYHSLEQRSEQLMRTNRELELAARSAAVGAITGHLMHGLKNPLAGLQSYLKATSDPDARNAADRMQAIINETLAALRAEGRNAKGLVDIDALRELLQNDCKTMLRAKHQSLVFEPWEATFGIPLRELNLLSLVLKNLIQNASDVSASGEAICISLHKAEDAVRFTVADKGPGVDDELKEKLFTPLDSTKEGGTGLGLALSKQMMRSIGGDLCLAKSDSCGAVFEVKLHVDLKKGLLVCVSEK